MIKTYEEYLELALDYREMLDKATANQNQKSVIYYRGKYIAMLKKAYRIDNEGILPKSVSGLSRDVPIIQEIQRQLKGHQRQIDVAIRENTSKETENPSVPKEIALKFRKLATRISQVNFKTGTSNVGHVALDLASLSGSIFLKAPVAGASKVISSVGPLAIRLFTIPVNLFWATFFTDANLGVKEKDQKKRAYDQTVVYKLSESLQNIVKNVFENVNDITKRM